jgi:hypothetical protein
VVGTKWSLEEAAAEAVRLTRIAGGGRFATSATIPAGKECAEVTTTTRTTKPST